MNSRELTLRRLHLSGDAIVDCFSTTLTFSAPIDRPIGADRSSRLGVTAPVQRSEGIYVFVIKEGLATRAQPSDVARALRRAAMARVQEQIGPGAALPTFFTGHEVDGSPARTERCGHLAFAFDPGRARLLIIAPHVLEKRDPVREEVQHLRDLAAALTEFHELRAGSAGRLTLRASAIEADEDPLFSAARTWESVTPYQVTRHTKHVSASEALSADLRAECRRRRLPEPRVTLRNHYGMRGVGLVGSARLTFELAVGGPIVLGKSRYLGGGLFRGTAR